MAFEDRYKPLLARRVAREDVKVGRAYVIHARNGGVGVAVIEDACLGYQLHREKFGERFLFIEYDWDQGPPHGTAIPLAAIDGDPPAEDAERLAWLRDREDEHRDEIRAAWSVILGSPINQGADD